jgi:multimeric flavodoxin WrbA
MTRVLIVYHSQSGNTKAAAEAVAEGVSAAGGRAVLKEALKATPEDLLECDTVAFGTPDYFSYMAGGLKDFFDRAYYPTHGKVNDRPCGIFVTHGGGGSAVDSVKSLCTSFKLRLATAPVLVQNRPDQEAVTALQGLGKALASEPRP